MRSGQARVGVGILAVAAALIGAPASAEPLSECAGCHAKVTSGARGAHEYMVENCKKCHKPSAEPGNCKGPSKGWSLIGDAIGTSCAKCHKKSLAVPKGQALHGSVKKNQCVGCHNPHATSDKPKLLVAEGAALCQRCHGPGASIPAKVRVNRLAKNTHEPVKDGDCMTCHTEKHAGGPMLLNASSGKALCARCHKMDVSQSTHAPVREGNCISCHDGHGGGSQPHLLHAAGEGMCLSCHAKGAKSAKAKSRVDLKKTFVHGAVASGGCIACHDVGHGTSGKAHLLKGEMPQLCWDCHERIDERKRVHSPVREGQCFGCHDAHASNAKALLRADAKETCGKCHDLALTRFPVPHAPVAKGDCAACHDPHGSEEPGMLQASTQKVCTRCHEKVGTGQVKHQVMARRGCTACHEPHGGTRAGLLVKDVNAMCTRCHANVRDGKHVPGGPAEGHKVSGGNDPRRKGKPFSCASCHDPHGSDFPVFSYAGATVEESCKGCHKK